MSKTVHTVYVFDCPVHGRERGAYCFRAYQVDLRGNWTKVEYIEESVRWNTGELDEFHNAFIKRAIGEGVK